MPQAVTISIGVLCLLLAGGCWLIWQLLRQNGRVLLRLEEVEKQLDHLEFGAVDESERGSPEPPQIEAGDSAVPLARASLAESEVSAGEDTRAPLHEPHRAARFKSGSLAHSRITRDGLKAGTAAPDFRLPSLVGSDISLQDLRGRRVLLVFSDPHCGPCAAVAPELQKFHREHPEIVVLMISRGEPRENRAKVKEHGLTFSVVLQQRWEISRLYAMFATPIAYVIDEAGVIAHDVAVGVEPILAVMRHAERAFAITEAVNKGSDAVVQA